VNDVEPAGTFAEDDAAAVSGTVNLLTNDSDVDVEPINTLVLSNVSSTKGGLVNLDTVGNYDYDANGQFEFLAAGESTTDTFTYTVTDGTETSTATVTVTVNGANDAPTAVADFGSADEDSVLNVGPLVGIVSNDTDPDLSDVLTVNRVGPDSLTMSAVNVGVPFAVTGGGQVTVDVDGSYSFDPNGAFEDLDDGVSTFVTFNYEVTDSNGGLSTTTVTIEVNGANDAPVNTAPAAATVDEDVATAIAGVSVADVDAGENVTTTLTVTNGTVTVAAGGTQGGTPTALTISGTVAQVNAALAGLAFTSDADFNGAASIQVSTSDGDATDVDTINVTVDPVNDAPVITSAPVLNAAGTGIVFTATDVDGDTLSLVTSLNNGATAVNNGASTTLTATAGVSVSDIALNVTDGTLDTGLFSFVNEGTAGPDVFTSSSLPGSTGFIFGLGGDDTITVSSLQPDAVIVGGEGSDSLSGNGGTNTFVFDGDIATGGGGIVSTDADNTITDFNAGSDLIDFVSNGAFGSGITSANFASVGLNGGGATMVNGFSFVFDASAAASTAASLSSIHVAAFLLDVDGTTAGNQSFTFAGAFDAAYVAVTDGTDLGIFSMSDNAGGGAPAAGELEIIVTLQGVTSISAADLVDFI
jgi:VCBS repeat-containing protein